MPEQPQESGADDFLAGRALAQQSVIDRAWESLGAGKAPEAAPARAGGAAARGAAAGAAAPAAGSAAAPAETAAPELPQYWDELSAGNRMVVAPAVAAPPLTAGEALGKAAHAVGAVGSDIWGGIIDSPRQAWGGIFDFVNNLSGVADKVAAFAEQHGVPDVYAQLFDHEGKWAPALYTGDQFREMQAQGKAGVFRVPTTGEPNTVTGELLRAAVPFLLGRGAAPIEGGGVAAEAAKDFFGGALGSNPNQPRLSNIIDRIAPNFVTDFLKAKPEDEDSLLGNLKTGLEYSGLGVLASGAIRALKTLKSEAPELGQLGEGAKPSLGPSDVPVRETGNGAATAAAPERDIIGLGDPLAPAVQIRTGPQTEAMAEITAGRMQAAAGGEPSALGAAAAPRGLAVTEGALPHEAVPAEPQRLASWLVAHGGLQDQGGEVSHVLGDTQTRPGLISGSGQTLDDAARSAWEAGFLPGAERPDTNALLDAIRDDVVAGRPQYRAADANAAGEHEAALTRNSEIDRIGSEFDIPTRNITREDFWNAVADRTSQEGETQPLGLRDADNQAAFLAARTRLSTQPLGAAATGAPPEPTMLSDETIHAYLGGARVDNPVKINLARIGSTEDIADTLAQVSRTIPAQAVQSNEATAALSDALGLTPQNFLAGYKGVGLNAAETTAMRFTLDSSASQLVEFAKGAADPMAAPAAKAQFVRAFAVHRALQEYAENARAEAGRTLQSWAILSQQRSNYAKAIGDMMSAVDSQGDVGQMAERVAALGDPLKIGRFVAQSAQGSGKNLMLKVWYNALLSGRTVPKKIISDMGMATWNTAATYLAEKFGTSGQVQPGEALQLMAGYTGAMKDALRVGGKALGAGESQFMRDYTTLDWARASGGSPEEQAARVTRNSRLSALMNGAPADLGVDTPERSMFEYLRTAVLPTSWIAGADDFAKVWNFRAEARRLAWRAAEGDPDKFANLLDNMPYSLNQQAATAALKNVFQAPLGPIGQAVNTIANWSLSLGHGSNFELPLGRLLFPFTRVPANIAKTALENGPLAPLSREVQATLAGGPSAARDLALAKIGMGSAVTLGLADLALNNFVTGRGPSDPNLYREWRAAGNQPYSLQIPGLRPVQLNQIEPFGLTFGAVADTFNILKFSEDEKDFGTLLPSLALGIGNAMVSKTYFEGVARFLDAMQHPESEGSGWEAAMAAGFMPQAANILGDATDNWQRAHYATLDAMEARLPWLRLGLPPQRTLWGDPVPVRQGFMPFLSGTTLANAISPTALGPDPATAEPIDRWIWDNRDAFGLGAQGEPKGIGKLSRTQSFPASAGIAAQILLSPQAYDRLQLLAGNELKDPRSGLGAKDTLNALVQGQYPSGSEQREWNRASPAAQALMVRSIVNKYRSGARQQLRAEFPDLEETLQSAWQAKAAGMSMKFAP